MKNRNRLSAEYSNCNMNWNRVEKAIVHFQSAQNWQLGQLVLTREHLMKEIFRCCRVFCNDYHEMWLIYCEEQIGTHNYLLYQLLALFWGDIRILDTLRWYFRAWCLIWPLHQAHVHFFFYWCKMEFPIWSFEIKMKLFKEALYVKN